MTSPEPMVFELDVNDFDLDLLPLEAREIGGAAFRQAVTTYFEGEFADLGGRVTVDFAPDKLLVSWKSEGVDKGLYDESVELLQKGELREAVPLLRALVAVEPKNADAHYNLGMALSDLGELDTAQLHLLRAVHLDAENVNALVALGVALYRAGDASAAKRRLEQAIDKAPDNGYAHRNLAAVLGSTGEPQRAIQHLRQAYRLLPSDQATVFGLANALDQFGEEHEQAEADNLYKSAIALRSHTDIAELARQARSRIAQESMRSAGGAVRMDAVMYCLGALERFQQMQPNEVQGIGFEIALLGQGGIDVNNPDATYTLRTLPGKFTGLQLMSLMYVAFKQIAPDQDIGFDLSAEYQEALSLYEVRKD